MKGAENDDFSGGRDVEKGPEGTSSDPEATPGMPPIDHPTDLTLDHNLDRKGKINGRSRVFLLSKLWHLVTSKSNADGPIDTNPPPDGGIKAWIVVVMCHLTGFNTWGFLNSFGVLQSYYVAHLGRPPTEISWIGSVQGFMLFFFSAFSGRISDAGYFHQTLFAGTALQILGVFGASFAKNYWQFLLSQGVCVGIGGGLVFVPALSLVGTYFEKRRSLALSICACGNSVGGLFYAAILQNVLPKLGLAWTLRVIAFVFVGVMIPANLLLKPRAIKRSTGPMVEWAAFKEPPYAFFSAGMFLCMVGMWVPVFYVSALNAVEWDSNLKIPSLDHLQKTESASTVKMRRRSC